MRLHWLALSACAALACSSGEDAPRPTAPPATPEPAETTAPSSVPAPPTRARAADAANGGRLYATYCASCHGARGAGDGRLAASLDPRPARHDDGAYMNALSDEHLAAVIKLGGAAVGKSPMMAPWGGTLDDDEIRDVIAFVRSLAEPPTESAQP